MPNWHRIFPRTLFAALIICAAFAVSGQGCQSTGGASRSDPETQSERDRIRDEMLRDSYRQYRNQ